MPNSGFEHRAENLHSSKIHQQGSKPCPHRVLYVMGLLEPSFEALSLFLLPAQTPDSLSLEYVGTRPSCQPLRPPTAKDYIFLGPDANKKTILITIFTLIVFALGDIRLKTKKSFLQAFKKKTKSKIKYKKTLNK